MAKWHLGGFGLGCLAVLAMLSLHGPAAASTDEDWGQCAGKDLDAAIAACSQIMQRRPVEAWKLGNAHNQRGLAHAGKGDYDRAIDDYSRAIYLNAGNAWPYNNRGLAHAHKGAYDQAIADYTKAIELEPESA